MKTLLILSLVMPFILSPFTPRSSGKNPTPQGTLVQFEYKYNSTAMYPLEYYRVDRDKEGTLRLSCSDGGRDIRIYRAPEDLPDRIDALMKEYKLYKMKQQYWPRMDILDGHTWSIHFAYSDCNVSTSGQNAWPPKKRTAGIKAITLMLQNLVESYTEADIIGHASH